MKKSILIAVATLLSLGTVPALQARMASGTEHPVESGVKATGRTIHHEASATGRTMYHGAQYTGRAVKYGAKETARGVEAVGERTGRAGESFGDRLGSSLEATGRTIYHIFSPQRDLNVPWNERQNR